MKFNNRKKNLLSLVGTVHKDIERREKLFNLLGGNSYKKLKKNLNPSYKTQSEISVFHPVEMPKFESNGTFLNIPIYFKYQKIF
jgi:hypothetical protein